MHQWSWQTEQGIPYLTCSLLARWPHGFFTRQSWPQVPQELSRTLHPEPNVFRVKQVHGNRVLSTTEAQAHSQQDVSSEVTFPDADGLFTQQPQQAVWVCSADCTPMLIADERTGHVAAVHAGWRGTAARIGPVAVTHLQAQGSRLADLRVAMGPAIAGEVYQVTTEVAVTVGKSLVGPEALTASNLDNPMEWAILEQLMNLPKPPIWADAQAGRVRLDVRQVNALQLVQLGLDPEQIAIAPHCTYQDPERFFSYRRDGLKQVQWSGIVSD
jgi:polyphenol oxidase